MKQNTTLKKILVALSLMLFAAGAGAQTENPRGIYRLVALEGKTPLVNAPFDQYKVVTNDITLTLFVQPDGSFNIANTDGQTLNYTGSEPKTEGDHSMRIYDSDARGFKLKWWSTVRGHMYFPEGGWVTEHYESGKYSDNGRIIFDALLQKFSADPAQPLVGAWRQLGWMDELRNTKKTVAALEKNYATSPYYGTMMIIMPDNVVYYVMSSGDKGFRVQGAVGKDHSIPDRNTIKVGDEVRKVTWVNKNTIAIALTRDWRTDYAIYSRIGSESAFMDAFATESGAQEQK